MPSEFNQDALEAYRAARKAGQKYVSDSNARNKSGLLRVLETIMRDSCSEIPLGEFEIPLKKIVGTMAAGRQASFAANFMPLLDDNTEFAGKWQSVYKYQQKEGIGSAIKVHEYLGYYYVVEGNKRVSVLKYNEAYSIMAEVTRLLPAYDENEHENRLFYEYIGENKRTVIKHMWFSVHGRYTEIKELAEAARKENTHWEEDFLETVFFKFRRAYHQLGFTDLKITTGDAFYAYVTVYGFSVDLPDSELKSQVKKCFPRFQNFVDEGSKSILGDPAEVMTLNDIKSVFLSLFNKTPRIGFVFSYTPEDTWWSQAHEIGRYDLIRNFPEMSIMSHTIDENNVYQGLSAFVKNNKPDILFVTNQRFGTHAVRLALENKTTSVFHCYPDDTRSLVPTYYGKPQEAAFLCGVIAGACTRTGSVAYIDGGNGMLMSDVHAFAQGAATVRPSVRVLYKPPGTEDANKKLAEQGCDTVFAPYSAGKIRQRKAFPGVYAYLCGIDPEGIPLRYYAAASYNWDMFYTKLIESIGKADLTKFGTTVHFRMGVSTGVVDVNPICGELPMGAQRLLTHYKQLLSDSFIKPIDENFAVEIIE